jgi:hypothetical protein
MKEKKLKIFFEGENIATQLIYDNLDYLQSSIERCDVLVSSKFEVGLYDTVEIQKRLNSYKKLNKIVLVFLVSDTTKTFKIPNNVILYRTSLYKRKKNKKELLLPYIWECYEKSEKPLPKTSKPKVGFCGNVNKNLGKRLTTIKALEQNKNIETDFILRKGFWAGKPNDEQLKMDYINNLIHSHFTICNRGRGNFAIRFYQALSLGRIPVLIDSDMVFPFEDEINWDEVIIKANNETELAEKIVLWWQNKSEEEVINAQLQCRKIYEKYLTAASFSKILEQAMLQKVSDFDGNEQSKNSFFQTFLNKIFK